MNSPLPRHIVTGFAFLATLLVLLTPTKADPSDAAAAGSAQVSASATPYPSPAPAWLSRVNAGAPGAFPPPRAFKAIYRFSWSDVEAARAEVATSGSDASGEIVTRVTGRTEGFARALYQVDATHVAVADRHTLRPLRLDQTEVEARKHKSAHVDFSAVGAERTTEVIDKKSAHSPKTDHRTKSFRFPGMFDMHSGLLYIRSLPLAAGDKYTFITMTAGNPYLASVEVIGRGALKAANKQYPAIECAIGLSKINKRDELEPHKSFKSAHVWLSDDSDRLILKAEAQVFIGTVTLDLVSVSFPEK